MNIELLQQIKQRFLEQPERLAMEDWGFVADMSKPEAVERAEKWFHEWVLSNKSERDIPPCGAVGCIAGNCILLTTDTEDIKQATDTAGFVHLDYLVDDSVFGAAAKRLDLSELEAARLFYFGHWEYDAGWPPEWDDRYKAATTPVERAQVTAARIDHFIATGGTE